MNALSWIVDDSFSMRLTVTLLHFLWQGCCVGLIVMLGDSLLRGATARFRYSFNVGSMLMMAAFLPITFLLVDRPDAAINCALASQPIHDNQSLQSTTAPSSGHPNEQGIPNASDVMGGGERVVERSSTSGTGVAPTEPGSPRGSLNEWVYSLSSLLTANLLSAVSRWITPLYLAGVTCILGRLLLGVWGGHRLRRMAIVIQDDALLASFRKLAYRVGLKAAPTVAWCEQISIPIVVGIVKPMILLPMAVVSNLTFDQVQALILHELSHIRRFDPIVNLLQRIVEAILFFHPVVWFVSRQISIEREHAADDMVLAAGWEPPFYADALVRVAELATGFSSRSAMERATVLGAAGSNPSEFKIRILRLLGATQPPRLAPSRTSILLVTSLILMGGVFAWSQSFPRQASGELVDAADTAPAAPLGQQPLGQQLTGQQPNPKEREPIQEKTELRTLRTPELLLPDHWSVMSVGFDNEDKELVTASTQSFVTIRRWDVVGNKLISEIKLEGDKHGRQFREGTLTLSGDRHKVVAATDEYVGIWDTATGKLLKRLPFPTKKGIYDCCIDKLDCTPDLSVIAGNWAMPGRLTLSYDAHVMIWDGNSGNLLQMVVDKGATILHSIDLSTDGKRLATTNGGGARIWDTSTGEQLLYVPNDNKGRTHSDPEVTDQYTSNVWCVQFSPSGEQLAIGDILGVKLVDAISGKLLQQLKGPHRYGLGSLVFSKDGRFLGRLGTGDRVDGDKSAYVVPIWSTQTGQKRFELHTESNDAAFSDDGQRLAVGISDIQQALSIWRLSGNAENAEPTAGPGPVSRQDKVEENGHYRGQKAAEFIDTYRPVWGSEKLGIQYGIALTKPQRQFRIGERVPLVVFFRNTSDKQLKIDMRPDFFGNTPKVVDAQGVTIGLENAVLLGSIPHYVEPLEPGEAVGPFYMNFGLGENPQPGRQNWRPYLKMPVTGQYKLTHSVSINVAGQQDGEQSKRADITTGTIEFAIVHE